MRRYFYSLAMDQRTGGVDPIIKFILKLLSHIYRIAVNFRNFLYEHGILKSYAIGIPVISIGNITMGGSGKTPLVIFFAQWLVEQGFKPVILIRGYMADRTKGSDEVKLFKSKLKNVDVVQGADRVKNAREYLKGQPCDMFILDDGFQHRKISRDLNIVALDMTNPFGNGELIPRGILREPPKSLKRSDVVILTRTDLGKDNITRTKDTIARINPRADIIETIHKPLQFVDLKDSKAYDLSILKGKSILAFCGIGNPAGFEGTLRKLGINIMKFEIFDDHYSFGEPDIQRLIKMSKDLNVAALVTTPKDAVKLKPYLNYDTDLTQFFYLDITIEVTSGQERLFHRIHHLLYH